MLTEESLNKDNINVTERIGATKIDTLALYLAFAMYCTQEVLGQTGFLFVYRTPIRMIRACLMVSTVILLTVKLIAQMNTHQNVLRFLFGIVFTVIASHFVLTVHDTELMWIVLFMISSKDIDIVVLAKVWLITQIPIILLTVISSRIGVIPTFYMYSSSRAVRSSMGFSHPNVFAIYVFDVCLAYLSVSKGKRPLIGILVCILCLLVNRKTSLSSTIDVGLIVLILLQMFSNIQLVRKILPISTIIIVISCVIFSYYMMINYDPSNPIHYLIDSITHGRFYFGHDLYIYSKPSFFGNDYSMAPVQGYSLTTGEPITFFADNSYIRLLLRFGYFGFFIVFIPVFSALWGFCRTKCFKQISLGILVFSIIGITESYFIDIVHNYFIIAAASYAIYHRGKQFDIDSKDYL